MLLDFYCYDGLEDFISKYDFKEIEPFTLLVVNGNGALELNELRWDGKQLHNTPKDIQQAHIWSSVTLYDEATIQRRRNWFDGWIDAHADFRQEDILSFHLFAGDKDGENDLVMNRADKVLTLSITSILRDEDNYKMTYKDLKQNKEYAYRILQSKRLV